MTRSSAGRSSRYRHEMSEDSRSDPTSLWTKRVDEAEQQHATLRATQGYSQELDRLDKISFSLIHIIRNSWLQSSRHPPLLDELLMYSATDDTIESLVAIRGLVHQGVHNVARRECRYLLELAVKFLFVDQQLPDIRSHTRQDRLQFLADRVPRSSIESVWELEVILGGDQTVADYRNDVKRLWSQMAGYIHPSTVQAEERLRRAARGAYIGFEDARSLRSVVSQLTQAYDQLGTMWLMAAGPSAAGEILTEIEQTQWAFRNTKWLPAMSRHFDYKAERRAGGKD